MKCFVFVGYATLVRQDCTLELDMSYFQDSIIPEHIESMWGPVPLPPLPPGVNNMCQVADHKYVSYSSFFKIKTFSSN